MIIKTNEPLDYDLITIIFDVDESGEEIKAFRYITHHDDDEYLTLDGIVELCKSKGYKNGTIEVLLENPLRGKTLRYGNYGQVWNKIGDLCGYA